MSIIAALFRCRIFGPVRSSLLLSWLGLAAFSLLAPAGRVIAQPDYPPAIWRPPACTKWYTTGNGRYFLVMHDMEGYYWTSISYLNRCDTDTNGNYLVSASVHYLVNGLQNGTDGTHSENNPSDPPAGEITQSVRESNYAWHAICLNRYSFGTEHEGFASNPAWFSEAMYQASAGLQRHLCDTYGVPMDRNHIIGHGEWQNPGWSNWMAANFPAINVACNTHTDPGLYWNWGHFMSLITGTNYGMYWDPNGATPGAGSAPSGTWDITSANWTTDPTGSSAPGPWTGVTAIFSAGSDATGAYTITVSGVQTVNHLLVRAGTATFGGGQLNFKGLGSYYSNYVAAGATAIYNVPFGGSGSPDKWGPGKAVYNGTSSSAGYYTLNEGTIAIGNNSAFSTVRLEVGDVGRVNPVTLQSADATSHSLATRLVLHTPGLNFGAGGDLTFTGPVDLGANSYAATLVSVSNTTTTLSGTLTNTAGIRKAGPGTLALAGTAANTFGSATANGYTTVNAGTLKLAKSVGVAAVANGTLVINTGGSVLLGNSDQVANSVPLVLAGGTLRTAGFNEQFGTLQLTGNSVIDLGGGNSVVRFAASGSVAWTAGRILTISNWSGSIAGGGAEQVYVGASNAGLTAAQLAQVRFANPFGAPAGIYYTVMLPTGELVPAEPPTLSAPQWVASSGAFQMQVSGVPGQPYAVWASTNLLDWMPLLTNPVPFLFTDTNAAGFPLRFYRGLYQP